MDNKQTRIIFILLLFTIGIKAQSVSPMIPANPDTTQTFLFYLHGGIVQEQGINAVSPYYGKYEYLAILDSLSSKGYHVISEARPKGTEVKDYALKVKNQVDTLLSEGVAAENIVIVGASLGAYIAMETALQLKHPAIRYIIIGLCSVYARNYFGEYRVTYKGHFLSIYERSDSKGSCKAIFPPSSENLHFEEIELNTGLDHAFLYKPYKAWVQPVVNWVEQR